MFRHSRWIRFLCVGIPLLASSVQAQTPGRSPKEIGKIINAALQAVIPPETRLTSYTISERGMRFDYGRTMALFGVPDNAEARASLGLTRTVADGSIALLEDCDQRGTESCERLGRAAYVYLEPISVSDSQAIVRVHVYWATQPSGRAYLSGSSTEVVLKRSGSAPWRFIRTGRVLTS